MSHLRSTSHTMGDADFPYIYKKGPAFGMPGVRVDGMDVLKVCVCGGGGGGTMTGVVGLADRQTDREAGVEVEGGG